MTAAAAADIWKQREAAPESTLALVTAWVLGQRIGDVLKWRTNNIQVTRRSVGPQTITVLVVEGKTIQTKGPYTIHLPTESLIARSLWELAQSRVRKDKPYLFIDAPTIITARADINPYLTEAKARMRKIFSGDLRSPRRGGLSSLSLLGLPEQQLCTLSRHPDVAMLRRYLAAGRLNNYEAELQCEAVSLNEAALNAALNPCDA